MLLLFCNFIKEGDKKNCKAERIGQVLAEVAAIYLVTGLLIAIISGWVIGRFKLEHWIEDWVQAMRAGEP